MGWLAPYRTLSANGPLVRLLVGEFVSTIGDWLYFVALLVLVYQDSPSPAFLGLVGAARQLPYVVLSVPAGVIADRFDRRRVLLATNLLRAGIMAVLTIVSLLGGSVWLVFGLAVLATCFATPFGPTIGAFLPALVRDESEFGPANHAFATLDNLAFGIGPAAGGLLIVLGGLPIAFALNAAAFAVGAVVVWRMPVAGPTARAAAAPTAGARLPDLPSDPTGPLPSSVPARHVVPLRSTDGSDAEPTLRGILGPLGGLLAFSSVTYFFTGGLEIITILIAVDLLGAGEGVTGFLNAAIGVGGVVGALVSGALVVRRRFEAPIVLGAIAMGAGLIATGLASGLVLVVVALAVMEAGDIVLDVAEATLLHRSVPDALRGRAFGTVDGVRKLALLAGAVFLPVLAQDGHVREVLVGSGIVTIVACIGLVVIVGVARAGLPPVVVAAAARVPSLPIFAGLAPDRLEHAMEQMREVHVAAGQPIVREGEPADRFYVIAGGRFRVSQAAPARDHGRPARERVVRRLGAGDVFGEIGLLRGIPRTATVTAETDGVLASLEAADFIELVTSGPGLRSRFLNLYGGGGPLILGEGIPAGVTAGALPTPTARST